MLLAQLQRNLEFRSVVGVGKLGTLHSATDLHFTDPLGSTDFQNLRVLYVDDDTCLLATTKQILELQNPFHVEIASSVRDALKKLDKLSFDVIVSDYQMPEKDGLTFLKELRETGSKIPFILFTGKGREEVAIKALNIGADYYLNKHGPPKTVYPQLSHYILQAVNKRKAEQRLTHKLEFESVISRISARFVNPPNFDIAINESLENIGQISSASRVWLFLLNEGGTNFEKIYEWCSESTRPILENLRKLSFGDISWGLKQLRDGKTIQIPDVSLLPHEMNHIKELLESKNIKAILVLPILMSDELAGFIGLNNVTETEFWGSDDVFLLQIVLELIGTYLERKLAYEKLQENEKNYRLLTENITDVIFIQDMNLNITYASPSVEALTGYAPEEVLKLTPQDYIASPSFERALFNWKNAITQAKKNTGNIIRLMQYEYIRKDGSTFWGELKVKFLRDAKGRLLGTQGVLRDITERKKIEEKLKESEEKYRLLTENITDVVFIQSLDLSIKYVSPSVESLSGYTPEEIIKLGPKGLMTPASYERGLVQIQTDIILSSQNPNYNPAFRCYEYVRKDGSTGWGEFKPKFLRDSEGNIVAMQGTLRDVTERKKAENALHREQEKLEMVTGTLKAGLSIISKDYTILYANKFLIDTFGDVIGKTCYSVYNDLGTVCPNCGVKEIFETGKNHTVCEQSVPGHDGQRACIELTANPIRDQKGNIIAVSELSIRIDERKRMENKLRQAQKRYRFLFEKAPVGISIIDLNGCLVEFNDVSHQQLGYSREEFKQLNVADFEVLETKDKILARIERIQKTGKDAFETKHRTKKGKIRDLVIMTQLIELDGKQFLYCIARDITEKKKTEIQLFASEKKYREMINAMSDLVWVIDFDGNITDVNGSAVSALGYSRAELLSMKVKEIDLDVSEKVVEGICERLFAGFTQVFRSVYTTKDGRSIPVEVNASPMVCDGKDGILCIARDVTERQKTEESMDKIMKELLVINEKLSVVGKLTRHDVRNKLSVISNNIYLARKQFDQNKDGSKYFDTINSTIDQVDRIFSFAQTYEQLGVEELSEISVKKTVNEAISLFSNTDGVRFVNGCSGLFVMADSLLRQIFYNFIDDSLKHGEKVSHIKVYFEEQPEQLKIIYEDDGIGIPENEKEISFKEGYGKDTGYGLYLIQKICEVYGWTITETGKQGQGVKFVIFVPKFDNNRQLYTIEFK